MCRVCVYGCMDACMCVCGGCVCVFVCLYLCAKRDTHWRVEMGYGSKEVGVHRSEEGALGRRVQTKRGGTCRGAVCGLRSAFPQADHSLPPFLFSSLAPKPSFTLSFPRSLHFHLVITTASTPASCLQLQGSLCRMHGLLLFGSMCPPFLLAALATAEGRLRSL